MSEHFSSLINSINSATSSILTTTSCRSCINFVGTTFVFRNLIRLVFRMILIILLQSIVSALQIDFVSIEDLLRLMTDVSLSVDMPSPWFVQNNAQSTKYKK